MALIEILMPKMGESIVEATILSWLKKPGDRIELEESLLEVATDKVDTEIPSTHAGVLKEILAKEGELIQVGSAIAVIEAAVEEKAAAVVDDQPAALNTMPAPVKSTTIQTNGVEHDI